MRYLRKHTLNILLFILWLGMGLSLATARADEVAAWWQQYLRATPSI